MFQATPEFLHDLEQNMRTIVERAYSGLLDKTWWQKVATKRSSSSKSDVLVWLISTAMIRKMQPGQAHFEDLLSTYTEITNEFASDGLALRREQLEDVFNGLPGGEGLQMASRWAQDIGDQAAYWPQGLVAAAILNGATAGYTTYDGLTFFNTAHYVNGVDTADGTFANILNPTTVGHATRIDAAITVDVAVENLAAIRAYIASIKMPNGVQPRNLRVKGILHPPALRSRVVQLCQASLIAQAAASGGGGADISPVVRDWAFEAPVEAPELGAGYTGGSDTSYYVIAGPAAGQSELGALVYQEREPFQVIYNGPMTDAELARKREFQWLCQGRNTVGYGHPYMLFKVNVA